MHIVRTCLWAVWNDGELRCIPTYFKECLSNLVKCTIQFNPVLSFVCSFVYPGGHWQPMKFGGRKKQHEAMREIYIYNYIYLYTHIYIYIHSIWQVQCRCHLFISYIRWEQVCTWDYFELESTIKSNHVSFLRRAPWGLVRLSHRKCVELPLCRRFEEICLRKGDGFVLFSSARGHLPRNCECKCWIIFQLQATGYPCRLLTSWFTKEFVKFLGDWERFKV